MKSKVKVTFTPTSVEFIKLDESCVIVTSDAREPFDYEDGEILGNE